MVKTEYSLQTGYRLENSGTDEDTTRSVEHGPREMEEMASRITLERIVNRGNLYDAYQRVKANNGAPGIDNMTVKEYPEWYAEHGEEWIASILNGTYKPLPVRRVEIPKDNKGGKRKLGIPIVKDRVLQQATAQILMPFYECKFAECSFAYRPHRGARQAMEVVKRSVEEGYEYACVLDLSKYFDTINHELLMNMLRQDISDKRVIELIKKFLKSGVMVKGLKQRTEEGSPQGGNLSPLLANIYLTPFDKEFEGRGVRIVRYADDILILAKSQRAAERLLKSSTKYLETRRKLKVNREKSKAISVYKTPDFKFLGFSVTKRGKEVKLMPHANSVAKLKRKLKSLTGRSKGRGAREIIRKTTEYNRGWVGYYGIADLTRIAGLDGWVRSRIRMCIWKQWKNISTRIDALLQLHVPQRLAFKWGKSQKGYWCIAHSQIMMTSVTNRILEKAGFIGLKQCYENIICPRN